MGKAQFYPTRFDIDVSVCMSCQICVEVCPFEAIKMDNKFELATDDRFGGLLLDRQELAKSNEYYHQIHPTEAAEVDARLAAERAATAAKARAAAEAAAAKAARPRPQATRPHQKNLPHLPEEELNPMSGMNVPATIPAKSTKSSSSLQIGSPVSFPPLFIL